MSSRAMPVLTLSEMQPGREADLFLLMTDKQELTTREGKPYFRVGFRDAGREVAFPIWGDSPLAEDCRQAWTPGTFYKLRALLRETSYGAQLEIRKIREATDADRADGFDPGMCLPQSRFDRESMYGELSEIARSEIPDAALARLVLTLLQTNRDALLECPAARRHHHAFVGGLLEHTVSVARNSVFLAEKYAEQYPDMRPPLDRGLVVAGAILHDIGKVRELEQEAAAISYTPSGELIGHLLLGRDMVREAAAASDLAPETLLRLEHVIIAHQRLPEWGSPRPPMTPEALLVHYADDIDAKYHMIYAALAEDTTAGPMTSNKNLLHQRFFRGRG